MAISLNTVISHLDTPSSLLPFFVKDAFDVTGRTVMANNEGGKHEAREKFIEEAGTSAFWIGGIPAVRWVANKIYKGKIDSEIQFKRINSDGIQGYFAGDAKETFSQNVADGVKKITNDKFSADDLKGIVLDGEKLEQVKTKLTKAKGLYKNYHLGVTTAAVLINLVMLSIALPQLNLFLSRKLISKEVNGKKNNPKMNKFDIIEFGNNKRVGMEDFVNKTKNNSKNPSFGGFKDLLDFKNIFNFASMAENAQLNPVNGMLLLDYGIVGSRVSITPRNNNERVENAIKEGGIIYFFYFASDKIKEKLCAFTDKVLNKPIDLDYKVLNSADFLHALKSKHDKNALLSFVELAKDDPKAELKVIKMIDAELAGTTEASLKEPFKNFTLKMAHKEGLIEVEYDNQLQKCVRHSKKYIQTDKVIKLNENIKNFYEKALEQINKAPSKMDIEKIISKTKNVKMLSIVGNIAICCASLSFIVPKIQYMIREHRTKVKDAPGIKHYQDMAKQNLI